MTFDPIKHYFVVLIKYDGAIKHIESVDSPEEQEELAKSMAKPAKLFGHHILKAERVEI